MQSYNNYATNTTLNKLAMSIFSEQFRFLSVALLFKKIKYKVVSLIYTEHLILFMFLLIVQPLSSFTVY